MNTQQTLLNQLFLPYISQLGMNPSKNQRYLNCGDTFRCDPQIGQGFCWVYAPDNRFSISNYDLKINTTVTPKYDHPEFFSICLANPATAGYILGSNPPNNRIISYTMPENTFSQTFDKGTHVRSSSLGFSPSFLKSLALHFNISYNELVRYCFNPRINYTIPKVAAVLKQIFEAKPATVCAAMYYEGKIMELLALLIQWQIDNNTFLAEGIHRDDLTALQDVAAYLKTHYSEMIRIETLEQLTYMGRNNLSRIFKLQYGLSITEYLRQIRMQQAKEILNDTTLSICSISTKVGYQNQGSFAERFKEETGYTPTEYRNFSRYH